MKKKSHAAFCQAALEHLDALFGTALRLTGQRAEAEDLVQETYLRAIRFRRRFQPGTNLRAWLFKMMFNLFINKYRRQRRTQEIYQGLERQDLVERMFAQDQLASSAKPEEYFFERLFSDDVIQALVSLPPEFKMVVLLVDINDFSYAEVAEILGIPVGTVMSRLHRGRKLLRAALYSFALEEGYITPAKRRPEAPMDLQAFRERKREG